jgi:uncharacterized cupin superfamily protein
MRIVKFRAEELVGDLGQASPVAMPLHPPISMVRAKSFEGADGVTETGLWECSPGVWRRQVVLAEFCYFVLGECTFTPDGAEPIEIRQGDAVYFPANTRGIWNVRSLLRKVYVVFGQRAA